MAVLRRTIMSTFAAVGAASLPLASALAADYPDRPIRFVVPFAAGGNADIVGRIAAEIVFKALGQPVVIENRAGAGGGVGAEYVARAAADGYTLLVASNGPMTVNPFVNANLSYDPLTDFVPVALTSYVPHVPIMSNKLGIKSIPELIALSNTRAVNIATSGVGSATHMTLERFKSVTGANLTHVPYRSGGALLPDVISGSIDGAMTEMSTAMELHKGGQARIVGVAAARRSKLAPEVATFDEQGVKGFLAQSFVGLVAPAKTPQDVVARLQKAIAAGLAPGGQSAERLTALGSELATPAQMTSAGFAAFIKTDYEDMRAAARLAGISTK